MGYSVVSEAEECILELLVIRLPDHSHDVHRADFLVVAKGIFSGGRERPDSVIRVKHDF